MKEELLKMKDEKTDKLNKAVQKRIQVQEKLSVIMKSIKVAEERVKELQDENNLRLTEILSILQMNNSPNVNAASEPNQLDEQKDLFLSELMELVDDSSPDDTTETLRVKMAQSVELCNKTLDEATTLASEFHYQEKLKITVQIYDHKNQPIKTCKWLESGFRFQPVSPPLMSFRIRQELILINYAIASFLRGQNVSLKSQQPALETTASITPMEDSTALLPQLPILPKNKFVLGQSSVFILRLFRSNKPIGELHILPAPTFHPEFVQKLGEFCHKTQQTFCTSVDKVL